MMSKPKYIVILTGLFLQRSGRRASHFYSFFSVNVLARVDFWPGLGLPRPKAIVVIPKNQPLPKHPNFDFEPPRNLGNRVSFFIIILFFYVFLSLLIQCKFANSTLLSLLRSPTLLPLMMPRPPAPSAL